MRKNRADYKQSVNSGNSLRDNPEPSLCSTHKGVETRHGSTQIKCVVCGKYKEASEFYVKDRKTGRKDSTCKACRIIQQRQRVLGVSEELYWELYHKQAGRCGICGRRLYSKRYKAFCVDHDHKTGEVRGLLCHNCNRAIGMLQDDPFVLEQAKVWVEGIVRHS